MTSIGQVSWYIFWVQLTLSLILVKTVLFRQYKYFQMNIYHVTFDYIKEE